MLDGAIFEHTVEFVDKGCLDDFGPLRGSNGAGGGSIGRRGCVGIFSSVGHGIAWFHVGACASVAAAGRAHVLVGRGGGLHGGIVMRRDRRGVHVAVAVGIAVAVTAGVVVTAVAEAGVSVLRKNGHGARALGGVDGRG